MALFEAGRFSRAFRNVSKSAGVSVMDSWVSITGCAEASAWVRKMELNQRAVKKPDVVVRIFYTSGFAPETTWLNALFGNLSIINNRFNIEMQSGPFPALRLGPPQRERHARWPVRIFYSLVLRNIEKII